MLEPTETEMKKLQDAFAEVEKHDLDIKAEQVFCAVCGANLLDKCEHLAALRAFAKEQSQ
jgi:hypothetical protein